MPVVFLHGGFANSDYFGHQIRHLAESSLSYSIVAVDTRGHGRSTDDLSRPLSYDLIAEDTIALMDHLKVKKFAVVGWSDGACTGFNLAMNYTERVDRVFSFGGTYSYTNVNETIGDSPVFTKYLDRVKVEYEHVSPTPQGYATFEERMGAMWSVEPVWRAESFQKIPSLFDNRDAPLMWIVDGDSEEACKRDVPRTLFDWVSFPLVSSLMFCGAHVSVRRKRKLMECSDLGFCNGFASFYEPFCVSFRSSHVAKTGLLYWIKDQLTKASVSCKILTRSTQSWIGSLQFTSRCYMNLAGDVKV